MADYTRREWLVLTGALTARVPRFGVPSDLDRFIEDVIRTRRVAGLAAAVVKQGAVVWSHGYGWANVRQRIPMDPDRSVQNVASVSKTVTATAVMQLFEQGRFQLDDDVNGYLPFPVRSPHHPGVAITFRQLLTHRSGIADGPAYGASYVCGDPALGLRAWLEQYLTPGGRYYDAKANWQPWKPGEQGALAGAIGRNYSNVGFGLLGFLAGEIAGVPFPVYCRDRIFRPLGMTRTAWHLGDLARTAHAVPYAPATGPGEEQRRAEQEAGLLGRAAERADSGATPYLPYCLYSFPNYPDGSLRTSVTQLARFLPVYLHPGAAGTPRILAPETVALMLSPQVAGEPTQGLCWVSNEKDGHRYWRHSGGDPGVATMMAFRPSNGVGVIVFTTGSSGAVNDVTTRLFDEAGHF